MNGSTKFFILGAAVALTSPASAQWTMSLPPPTQTSAYFANDNISREVAREDGTYSAPVDTVNKADAADFETLTYVRDARLTRATLQVLADRFDSFNPGNGKQAATLFASTDIIGAVHGVMDQYGLERNNVAHAYALYWITYWALANNEHDAPSARAIQAVGAQTERALAASTELATMNDRAKQAAAEELMALAAIFDATSELAKSDAAFAAQMAKASVEGSRKSGLDLDKMTLTDDGFVAKKGRKGADASGAAGGDKALASAGGDNTLTYGIMAALGLGAAFMIGKGMRKG
jgi:hypothetical protein